MSVAHSALRYKKILEEHVKVHCLTASGEGCHHEIAVKNAPLVIQCTEKNSLRKAGGEKRKEGFRAW